MIMIIKKEQLVENTHDLTVNVHGESSSSYVRIC